MHTRADLGGNTIRKYVPQTEWQQIQKYARTSWGAHPLRFTHTPPTAKPSLSFPLTTPRITYKKTEWQQIQIHTNTTNTTNTNKNKDKSCLFLPLPNNHRHCHPHSTTLSKCPHVLKPQDQGEPQHTSTAEESTETIFPTVKPSHYLKWPRELSYIVLFFNRNKNVLFLKSSHLHMMIWTWQSIFAIVSLAVCYCKAIVASLSLCILPHFVSSICSFLSLSSPPLTPDVWEVPVSSLVLQVGWVDWGGVEPNRLTDEVMRPWWRRRPQHNEAEAMAMPIAMAMAMAMADN